MGQPGRGHTLSPAAESIGRTERTRGTETSQYPQEEKSNEIPLVAASERGRAQTDRLLSGRGCRTANMGTWQDRRTVWEVRSERVRTPYPKSAPYLVRDPE